MPGTFTSSTHFEWIADKSGDLNFDDKETIPISVPGDFGGDDEKVNPEELLAGAVDACFGLTFLDYLSRSGAEIEEFEVKAEGRYEKGKNGLEFTEFILDARIGIGPDQNESELQELLEKGKTECLVTKTLNVPVKLEAEIYRV